MRLKLGTLQYGFKSLCDKVLLNENSLLDTKKINNIVENEKILFGIRMKTGKGKHLQIQQEAQPADQFEAQHEATRELLEKDIQKIFQKKEEVFTNKEEAFTKKEEAFTKKEMALIFFFALYFKNTENEFSRKIEDFKKIFNISLISYLMKKCEIKGYIRKFELPRNFSNNNLVHHPKNFSSVTNTRSFVLPGSINHNNEELKNGGSKKRKQVHKKKSKKSRKTKK